MAMNNKMCPECGSGYMLGTITQQFDVPSGNEQITELICPHCGYEETEVIPAPASLGNYNSGVGRLMEPIQVQESWGIYNSGIGYKPDPVPDPLK